MRLLRNYFFCCVLRDSVEDPLDDTGTVQQQLDQVTNVLENLQNNILWHTLSHLSFPRKAKIKILGKFQIIFFVIK